MSNSIGEPVLEVRNLTKIYGYEYMIRGRKFGRKVLAVSDASFIVNQGEIFGFLGPNGAGKTTTIRAILDFLKIQQGSITVFGFDHHHHALDIKRQIGYIPGDLALYENFTGLELIEYLNNFRKVDREFLKELKSVFKVDLTLKVKSLSTGNRQQLGLINALAPKPELLILDEPSSRLDPLMTANLHKMLKKLKNEGKTIFLSSHNLAEVQAICDRVGIIKEGKIILVESVEELTLKNVQNVKIRFSSTNEPTVNDFKVLNSVISVNKVAAQIFKLRIKGDVNELIKFLTSYYVERIAIEDATLEEIFLQYYQ